MACAVCAERLALAVEVAPDGSTAPHGWLHRNEDIRPRDHVAVPVTVEELVTTEEQRCDFCSRTPVTGEVRFRDFEWSPGQRIGERWPACAPCLGLVARNDWNGLLRRAEEGIRERTGQGWSDPVREAMRTLYRGLRKHQV